MNTRLFGAYLSQIKSAVTRTTEPTAAEDAAATDKVMDSLSKQKMPETPMPVGAAGLGSMVGLFGPAALGGLGGALPGNSGMVPGTVRGMTAGVGGNLGHMLGGKASEALEHTGIQSPALRALLPILGYGGGAYAGYRAGKALTKTDKEKAQEKSANSQFETLKAPKVDISGLKNWNQLDPTAYSDDSGNSGWHLNMQKSASMEKDALSFLAKAIPAGAKWLGAAGKGLFQGGRANVGNIVRRVAINPTGGGAIGGGVIGGVQGAFDDLKENESRLGSIAKGIGWGAGAGATGGFGLSKIPGGKGSFREGMANWGRNQAAAGTAARNTAMDAWKLTQNAPRHVFDSAKNLTSIQTLPVPGSATEAYRNLGDGTKRFLGGVGFAGKQGWNFLNGMGGIGKGPAGLMGGAYMGHKMLDTGVQAGVQAGVNGAVNQGANMLEALANKSDESWLNRIMMGKEMSDPETLRALVKQLRDPNFVRTMSGR